MFTSIWLDKHTHWHACAKGGWRGWEWRGRDEREREREREREERERERERDANGSHLKPRSEKYRSDTWPANRNSVKKTRLSLRFCLFPLWILASLEERDVEDSEEEKEKIERKRKNKNKQKNG